MEDCFDKIEVFVPEALQEIKDCIKQGEINEDTLANLLEASLHLEKAAALCRPLKKFLGGDYSEDAFNEKVKKDKRLLDILIDVCNLEIDVETARKKILLL